jgi:cyclopropane fatty-acyl-phospholipid synthase-like methyltransferase
MTAHHRLVIDYFDQTHNDYRFLWGIDRHLGLHCGFFDEQRRHHDDAVLHMNRVLSMMAGIGPGVRVLDAGCGIGGSAVWLAADRGAEVVGVNINAKQVEQARRLAYRHRLADRLQFHVADFCATGLASASCDVVWALESACYAEDKPAFLAEARRLLKPGGRLIVADGFLTRDDLDCDEQRIVTPWQRGWAIPGVASVDRYRRWLCETGFRDVDFRDITRHVVPSSRRIFLASVLFYPLGLLLYWLGLRTTLQTCDRCALANGQALLPSHEMGRLRNRSLTGHRNLSTMTFARIPVALKIVSCGLMGAPYASNARSFACLVTLVPP